MVLPRRARRGRGVASYTMDMSVPGGNGVVGLGWRSGLNCVLTERARTYLFRRCPRAGAAGAYSCEGGVGLVLLRSCILGVQSGIWASRKSLRTRFEGIQSAGRVGRAQGEGEGRVWMDVLGVVCRLDGALYVSKWSSSQQEHRGSERGGRGPPDRACVDEQASTGRSESEREHRGSVRRSETV